MGEKLRHHQICLKLNDREYKALKEIADLQDMKHTEVLRYLIRDEHERLKQWLAQVNHTS